MSGEVADVSARTGTRLTCMCDDCQAYAHWLGHPERTLDPYGGTEVFQVTPRQITLTDGTDNLACVRLTPKGLLRWHARCCRTPIANTLASPRVAFTGIVHTFMPLDGDDVRRTEVLGPIRARVQGRFAPVALPADAHRRAPLSIIGRSLKHLLAGTVRGAHRPSPFFDAQTGEPVVAPIVLAPEQRQQLRAHCGPPSAPG